MCGIAGLFRFDGSCEDPTEQVTGMLAAIAHRGPDGAGYVVDDGFAMGTVRLAPLSPGRSRGV